MAFLRETAALLRKNFLLTVVRRWLSTLIRAVLFPIVLMIIISQVKHWISAPARYGVGSPSPILDLADALAAVKDSHNRIIFINNGFDTGDVAEVIDRLSATARRAGADVRLLPNTDTVSEVCPSNGNGASVCYGGVSFEASPDHGSPNAWNYTMFGEGGLGAPIFVDRQNSDAQLYTLPLQHAVDSAITAADGGRQLPSVVQQYPFTVMTQAEYDAQVEENYNDLLTLWFGVIFLVSFVGVTYHLVGSVCYERESGMTQLLEAMMPHRRKWRPKAAKMLANHLTFDLVYLPSWLIIGIIVGQLIFTETNTGISVLIHLLFGLSLVSFSLLASSFFRRAQTAAIFSGILVIGLGCACQFSLALPKGYSASTSTSLATGFLFPPMTYIYLYTINAYYQTGNLPIDLSKVPDDFHWQVSGSTLLGFFAVQILLFPVLAVIVERVLWGTDSKARRLVSGTGDSTAVRLQAISKIYRPGFFRRKKNAVRAVTDLTLDLTAGSITVLLGANGSGKTTTLKMIAGLDTISNGSMEVDATGGIGICPQGNIHWKELTVYEHVQLLDMLKCGDRGRASREDIMSLIRACDLEIKTHAKAGTLSGGQMRKLQLAMMFAGGSHVCCVDEVSSGIDSLARRKIWEILLRERGSRTMLLTTHFLDEADVLSDHVAILSEGKLKAEGSTVQLKQSYGEGYRVQLGQNVTQAPEIPAFPIYRDYGKVSYHSPSAASTVSLLRQLESHDITDFQILGPTIEDVFLKLSDEVKKKSLEEDEGTAQDTPLGPSKTGTALTLTSGTGTGPVKQAWLMFGKRFIVLRNNYMPYFGVLLIPLAMAGILAHAWRNPFTGELPLVSCVNNANSQYGSMNVSQHWYSLSDGFAYGPPNKISFQNISDLFRTHDTTYGSPTAVNSLGSFQDYISTQIAGNDSIYDSFGGFFLSEPSPVLAWGGDNNYGLFAPFFTQNIMNNAYSDVQINAGYRYFGTGSQQSSGPNSALAIFMTLAMSVYAGLFAVYPNAERTRRVRALHYSNGVHSFPLWMGYLSFDLIWIIITSALSIVLFGVLARGWYHLEYLFVVFLFFGIASAAWSYLVALIVRSPLAAFAGSAIIQIVLMLLYFVSYFTTVNSAPPDDRDSWLLIEFFTIGLITPSGALLRALLVSLNEYGISCSGQALAANPGYITRYGGPILYLVLQSVVLMALVVWIDAGGRIRFRRDRTSISADPEKMKPQHTAALELPELLDARNTGLRVHNLTKAFGDKVAVDNVSFGVSQSESFALLGPNGAGKSTIISLIRGDLRPTGRGAQVFVDNHELLGGNRTAAGNYLGVCPQFDAMDSLTLIQYLRFYARIRGVPDVEHNVQELIRAVGLEPYKNRLAPKLSGGNQRKLSFAIALVANPKVLLLDEPSSGMDAAAKRAVWRVLTNITRDRSVIVTTHSMEEADTLCQRAGIVAREMLALDTTENLRKSHGDALYVHLIHKEAPRTSDADMEAMRDWVVHNIRHAEVEERTYHGQLRFKVPRAESCSSDQGLTAGTVFGIVEHNKDQLNISHYSVTQTTLDQVFFNVVTKHNVEEEGYQLGRQAKGWRRFLPRS